jgi:hypothetical protein
MSIAAILSAGRRLLGDAFTTPAPAAACAVR